MNLPKHIQEVFKRSSCLFTKEQVDAALDVMAQEMNQQLADKNPIILCVMIGGLVPVGNLLPRLDFPMELHYVHATRYRGDIRGGDLVWKASPSFSVEGRVVVVVDDILDGGLTLAAIMDYCHEHGAAEVQSAVLVDKHHVREAGGTAKADYTGLTVDDHYIFGYGMDYREYLRNAPGIYVVAPEDE